MRGYEKKNTKLKNIKNLVETCNLRYCNTRKEEGNYDGEGFSADLIETVKLILSR